MCEHTCKVAGSSGEFDLSKEQEKSDNQHLVSQLRRQKIFATVNSRINVVLLLL